jgi:hypothetical protein
MPITSSARVWFVENSVQDVQERSAAMSHGADEHEPSPMFARATSRRALDVLAGAAAVALIGGVWSLGSWLTGSVARALHDAQQAEISTVLIPDSDAGRGSALSIREP